MELSEVMRTTRTCRYLRPDPVPDDVLLAAFDDTRFAPEGGNRQPVGAHLAVGYPQRPFPTRLSRRPVGETVALDRFGTALFPPAG